jgi:hypothetical protein
MSCDLCVLGEEAAEPVSSEHVDCRRFKGAVDAARGRALTQ